MLPFSEYHIATSHNSYLKRLQCSCICGQRWAGTPSKNIRRTLEQGARMIEIDVHETAPGFPVVSHAAEFKGRTWFGSMKEDFILSMLAIKDFVEQHPATSPVILDFEFGSITLDTQDRMADVIDNILGRYLIFGRMDFRATYPENYLGKVLLSCGGGMVQGTRLINYMNVLQRSDKWFINRPFPETPEQTKEICDWLSSSTGFVRIYPKNVLLSSNFDAVGLMQKTGAQAVALNFGMNDKHLKKYINFFHHESCRMPGYRPIS